MTTSSNPSVAPWFDDIEHSRDLGRHEKQQFSFLISWMEACNDKGKSTVSVPERMSHAMHSLGARRGLGAGWVQKLEASGALERNFLGPQMADQGFSSIDGVCFF